MHTPFRLTPRRRALAAALALAVLPASSGAAAPSAPPGTWALEPVPGIGATVPADVVALDGGVLLAVGTDAGRDSHIPWARRTGGGGWSEAPAPFAGNPDAEVNGAVRAGDRVWAVGGARPDDAAPDARRAPAIARLDGDAWTPVAAAHSGPGTLLDVVAPTPDTAWAAGVDEDTGTPLLERFDGTEWTAVPAPAGLSGPIVALSAAGPDAVWAAGGTGDGSPAVARFDGIEWGPAVAVAPAGDLADVVAIAPDDVWAFGGLGERPLAAHWDGAGWTVPPGLEDAVGGLEAGAAVSGRDVWGLGGTVVHWDGDAWRVASTPERPREPRLIRPVTAALALPAGEVLALGRGAPPYALRLRELAVGDDGFAAARVEVDAGEEVVWRRPAEADGPVTLADPTPARLLAPRMLAPGGAAGVRFAAAGTFTVAAADHAMAVRVAPALDPERTDRAGYTLVRWAAERAPADLVYDVEVDRPGRGGFRRWLTAVRRPERAFAIDAGPGTYAFRARVRRPDAGASGWSPAVAATALDPPAPPVWTPMAVAPDTFAGAVTALSAWSPRDAWAADAVGNIGRWDGSRWVATGFRSRTPVSRLEAVDDRTAFGIGEAGALVRWDGSRWRAAELPCHEVSDVDGVARTDLWVVGDSCGVAGAGGAAHFDGTSWRPFGVPFRPLAVSARGDDVWVVGGSGTARLVGGRFQPVPTPAGAAGASLRDVVAVGGGEAWAIGDAADGSPLVLRWDSFRWRTADVALSRSDRLVGVDGSSPGDVWVIGGIGGALHWDGAAWRTVSTRAGAPNAISVLRSGRAFAGGCCTAGAAALSRLIPIEIERLDYSLRRAFAHQGETVAWHVARRLASPRSVTDGTGLRLFDVRRRAGSTILQRFHAAGAYQIIERTTGAGMVVDVPIEADGALLALSDAPLAPGQVMEVEVQRPGARTFVLWRSGLTDAVVTAEADAGPGVYRYRARLRSSEPGAATGWSPPRAVTLG